MSFRYHLKIILIYLLFNIITQLQLKKQQTFIFTCSNRLFYLILDMKLKELAKLLNSQLEIDNFASADASLNGVQVGDMESDIKKIALMVDASLEGFIQANRQNVDLVLTHHGLFWGKPLAITGSHYKRVEYLIKNSMALYSAHLPLDAHFELGNNIALAELLDLKNIEPFGKYKGIKIGTKGELTDPISVNEIKNRLVGENEPAYIIPGGKNLVKTVAIVSGGSPFSVNEAIDQGIDLFITGDRAHEVYHTCLEEGINMISAGHYATEIYGVQRIGKWITEETGIETLFIDLPSGT